MSGLHAIEEAVKVEAKEKLIDELCVALQAARAHCEELVVKRAAALPPSCAELRELRGERWLGKGTGKR